MRDVTKNMGELITTSFNHILKLTQQANNLPLFVALTKTIFDKFGVNNDVVVQLKTTEIVDYDNHPEIWALITTVLENTEHQLVEAGFNNTNADVFEFTRYANGSIKIKYKMVPEYLLRIRIDAAFNIPNSFVLELDLDPVSMTKCEVETKAMPRAWIKYHNA